jgi:hypothetical protein
MAIVDRYRFNSDYHRCPSEVGRICAKSLTGITSRPRMAIVDRYRFNSDYHRRLFGWQFLWPRPEHSLILGSNNEPPLDFLVFELGGLLQLQLQFWVAAHPRIAETEVIMREGDPHWP